MKNYLGKSAAITVSTAVMALLFSTTAQATFQISIALFDITSGTPGGTATPLYSKVIVDNDPVADSYNTVTGKIGLTGGTLLDYGGGKTYIVDGSSYTSKFVAPGDINSSSTSVQNKTGKKIEAFVFLVDTGFVGPTSSAKITDGGMWSSNTPAGNSITFKSFYDSTNTFGATTLSAVATYSEIAGMLTSAGTLVGGTQSFTSTGGQQTFGTGTLTTSLDPPSSSYGQTLFFDLILQDSISALTARSMDMNSTSVPEPTTYILLGISLSCVVVVRRKMKIS